MLRALLGLYRRHLFWGSTLILAVLCALLLGGILLFHPQRQPDLLSPSKKYLITATVEQANSTVKLHLKDARGQPISTLRTRASDVLKWALGWMPDSDTIVLYSADAGTLAYTIAPTGKITATKITTPIDLRAQELKKEKYQ